MEVVSINAVIGHVLVGRYRIEKLRSEGTASAPVFEAQDTHQRKTVAVRLMTISSLFDRGSGIVDENSALESFKSSMQQLFSIAHPSLVLADDWGDAVIDDVRVVFSVSQLFGKGSLREYLDRGR